MHPIYQIKFLTLLLVLMTSSCREDPIVSPRFETENVIVIVADGMRYSESWGDSTHQYIPRMANDLSGLGYPKILKKIALSIKAGIKSKTNVIAPNPSTVKSI